MARLYADEDFPFPVIHILRGKKHDIIRTGTGISDVEVLKDAISHKRTVLTLNGKHFKALHEIMPWHYGIIIGVHELNFAIQANAIHDFLTENIDMRGVCERVRGGKRRK